MPWYQLDDANDPKLDELARQYNLHPLHIEDTSNPCYDLLTRPNSNNLSAPSHRASSHL
jgi:hypothetical protein